MVETKSQDFNLCSTACERITQKYGGHVMVGGINEVERTVILVWTVAGIVENGGFRYLFGSMLPGDPNYSQTITAFENIGCPKAANTIRQAICLFPKCELPAENWLRIQYYEKQPVEIRHRLDTDFWNELDCITVCLASYIKKMA